MTAQAIVAVVEDELSEAIVRRIVADSGRRLLIDRVINARGNSQIRLGIPKYRNAAKAVPHLVLTDLDRLACAPELLAEWQVGHLPAGMLFRVAVREVEAWLLADRPGIAEFLAVSEVKIPAQPEQLDDPKLSLINIARKSRKRRLAEEIVPAPGSAAPYGPLYNVRLAEFVANRWNPGRARQASPSLDRTLTRVAGFLPT